MEMVGWQGSYPVIKHYLVIKIYLVIKAEEVKMFKGRCSLKCKADKGMAPSGNGGIVGQQIFD